MFKLITPMILLSFMVSIMLSSCYRSNEIIETLLKKRIVLPSAETKVFSFYYQLPKDGNFRLYLKLKKELNKKHLHHWNVTSKIRQTCEKLRKNITNPHSLGSHYSHIDKKSYDKEGQLTSQGKLLLENTRDFAVKGCINNYIFGQLSLYVEDINNSSYKYIDKDIGKGFSTSRKLKQKSYSLIQLNGTLGPFKKGTELKIVITALIEKDKKYVSPSTDFQLVAIQ